MRGQVQSATRSTLTHTAALYDPVGAPCGKTSRRQHEHPLQPGLILLFTLPQGTHLHRLQHLPQQPVGKEGGGHQLEGLAKDLEGDRVQVGGRNHQQHLRRAGRKAQAV